MTKKYSQRSYSAKVNLSVLFLWRIFLLLVGHHKLQRGEFRPLLCSCELKFYQKFIADLSNNQIKANILSLSDNILVYHCPSDLFQQETHQGRNIIKNVFLWLKDLMMGAILSKILHWTPSKPWTFRSLDYMIEGLVRRCRFVSSSQQLLQQWDLSRKCTHRLLTALRRSKTGIKWN